MKDRYGSTMINALKTVLPMKKQVKEKESRTIVLNLDREEASRRLELYVKKHQTARERLLSELINEKELDYRLVTGKLNVGAATIKAMEEQEVLEVVKKRVYRNSAGGVCEGNRITLNVQQEAIASSIKADIKNGVRKTYLIHGVTGSGKTEVYMDVIDEVVREGRQVIVLIPEIALTYQTLMRFYKRFGDAVSTLHSRLSDGERYDQFERA
ncbi:MAG: DEAD/DEAH box helicase family protein, partial [Lachnospiraceae bacterium]|nr:DEAD/DEAH box helicase family protein [Lachnospiraceae bacterium]